MKFVAMKMMHMCQCFDYFDIYTITDEDFLILKEFKSTVNKDISWDCDIHVEDFKSPKQKYPSNIIEIFDRIVFKETIEESNQEDIPEYLNDHTIFVKNIFC